MKVTKMARRSLFPATQTSQRDQSGSRETPLGPHGLTASPDPPPREAHTAEHNAREIGCHSTTISSGTRTTTTRTPQTHKHTDGTAHCTLRITPLDPPPKKNTGLPASDCEPFPEPGVLYANGRTYQVPATTMSQTRRALFPAGIVPVSVAPPGVRASESRFAKKTT